MTTKLIDKTSLNDLEYVQGQIRALIGVHAYVLQSLGIGGGEAHPGFLEELRTAIRGVHGKEDGDFVAGADEVIERLKKALHGRG